MQNLRCLVCHDFMIPFTAMLLERQNAKTVVSSGIEPETFRVLGECDNRLHHETRPDGYFAKFAIYIPERVVVRHPDIPNCQCTESVTEKTKRYVTDLKAATCSFHSLPK